jgi:hypothetical protein
VPKGESLLLGGFFRVVGASDHDVFAVRSAGYGGTGGRLGCGRGYVTFWQRVEELWLIAALVAICRTCWEGRPLARADDPHAYYYGGLVWISGAAVRNGAGWYRGLCGAGEVRCIGN